MKNKKCVHTSTSMLTQIVWKVYWCTKVAVEILQILKGMLYLINILLLTLLGIY